ncbi:GUN4 domain-containing protein [Dolichospermum sp. LEGE 00240]|nr:GUN4 domain-containing protein [Dolichospermum sp. LEGE 00240]MBE9247812.1 GUN4 domain-containing protein [Dolichospermum sp. LEGE 00240]
MSRFWVVGVGGGWGILIGIFSRIETCNIPHNKKAKNQNSTLPELDNTDLISAVGQDYRKLRNLLAAENWKEADMETARVMSNVAKLVEIGGLKRKYITNFPSKDLQTIDKLWVKYSNGKFGFSVQKKIYQELGGVRHYDDDVWESFIDEVGWITWGRSNWYSNVTFKKTAPQGHLPWQVTSVGSGRLWGWEGFLLSHRDL